MTLLTQYTSVLMRQAMQKIERGDCNDIISFIKEHTLSLKVLYSKQEKFFGEQSIPNPFYGEFMQPPLCDGIRIICQIPVEGDVNLLDYEPCSCHVLPNYLGHFSVDVSANKVILEYEFANIELPRSPEERERYIKNKIDNDITTLQSNEKAIQQDLHTYNKRVEQELQQCFSRYCAKKSLDEQTAQLLGAKQIIYENNNSVSNSPVTVKYRPIKSFASFQDVNDIIYKYGTSMEHTAKDFKDANEESLRSSILSSFKTHNIDALAETLNRDGKTDILVKRNKRTHVVECKIWKGSATTKNTLEQLLDYCTWHEESGTIIIFNKTVGNFRELLTKIETELSARSHFQKINDNAWRFIEDTDGEKAITVFCFDLFIKGYKSKQHKTKATNEEEKKRDQT